MKLTSLFRALLISLVLISTNCYADDYYNRDCDDLYDPFEKVNRKVFRFNYGLDKKILKPVAKGYDKAVPKAAKKRIRNFFANLYSPVTFINYLLQFKVVEATKTFWRFALNSTIGIGGLHDVASPLDITTQKQTFGNTLAYYGVRPGAYVMLPLLGPTNMRDMFDVIILDRLLNPITYNMKDKVYYPMYAFSFIPIRASLLSTSNYVEITSSDLYVSVRSMYHQKRENQLDYPLRRKCVRIGE